MVSSMCWLPRVWPNCCFLFCSFGMLPLGFPLTVWFMMIIMDWVYMTMVDFIISKVGILHNSYVLLGLDQIMIRRLLANGQIGSQMWLLVYYMAVYIQIMVFFNLWRDKGGFLFQFWIWYWRDKSGFILFRCPKSFVILLFWCWFIIIWFNIKILFIWDRWDKDCFHTVKFQQPCVFVDFLLQNYAALCLCWSPVLAQTNDPYIKIRCTLSSNL